MSPVAETPIGAFAAIHILSRGNDGQYLDYHSAFERWMRKVHGYSFERTLEGFRFVKGPAENREVLPGDGIATLPVKAYLLSFLEDWPEGAPAADVFRIFQRPDLAHSDLADEWAMNPRLFVDGSTASLLLVSIKECKERLIANLRNGAARSWGRPHDPCYPNRIQVHEPIPSSVYMGTPLLDWIDGSLGARGYERWEGRHVFPDPPLYINVQFELAEIEGLRSTLVEARRRPIPLEKSIDRAVQMFCEVYACNGVPVIERRALKKDALEHLKKQIPELNAHQFYVHIWSIHAPEAWRRRGRPKGT